VRTLSRWKSVLYSAPFWYRAHRGEVEYLRFFHAKSDLVCVLKWKSLPKAAFSLFCTVVSSRYGSYTRLCPKHLTRSLTHIF
jgi:hypothetical protein